jgi:hypothetical protein
MAPIIEPVPVDVPYTPMMTTVPELLIATKSSMPIPVVIVVVAVAARASVLTV